MGETITVNSSAVTLTNSAANPLTVAAGVQVTGTPDAIYGVAAVAWDITNYGRLNGATNGIDLQGGGSVTNAVTGTVAGYISAHSAGVVIAGDPGTVVNDGTIIGGYGVTLQAGGTVVNQLTTSRIANPFQNSEAVQIAGGSGTVVNNGTIYGNMRLYEGGSVTNTGFLIFGGIQIFGAAGVLDNSGYVSHSVDLGRGGTVLNQQAGYLRGPADIGGPGSIDNDGRMTNAGLYGGGQVTNGAVGLTAAQIGTITFADTAAGVTNFGSVGQITMFAGGSVVNGTAGAAIGTVSIPRTSHNGSVASYAATAFGTLSNDGSVASVYFAHGGIVANAGTIVATSGIPVFLAAGGSVLNGAGGATAAVITAVSVSPGVEITGGAGTVSNAATITGSYGVQLQAGGSVVNGAGGATAAQIIATSDFLGATVSQAGVAISGGAGTVANAATISGNVGVQLSAGGSVVNGASGATGALISGVNSGVAMSGANSTLTNYGLIIGGLAAQLYSSIAGTIVNAGNITSTGAGYLTIRFTGSGASRLVLLPGSSIEGYVTASSHGPNVLELASGPAAGTLAGQATNKLTPLFGGFSTLAVDPGAQWTISGNDTLITARIGTADVAGTLTVLGDYALSSQFNVTGSLINSGGFASTLDANVTLQGGALLNRVRGTIMGEVVGLNAPGVVTNNGVIISTGSAGVALYAGDSVSNGAGGIASAMISGTKYGVLLDGQPGSPTSATVVNDGTITGATGVNFGYYTTGSTLTNAGTIDGLSGPAVKFGPANDTLVIEPGAVFIGEVNGGGGTNTLLLGGGGTGTIAGLASNFINFQSFGVASGGTWSFGAGATIAGGGTLVNDGTLVTDPGGNLQIAEPVVADPGDQGTVMVAPGATVDLGDGVDGDQGAEFEGNGAGTGGIALGSAAFAAATTGSTLAIGDVSAFAGSIAHFIAGETIDVQNATISAASLVAGHLRLVNGSTLVASIPLTGSPAGTKFFTHGDGGKGTDVTTDFAPCFASGTFILTATGELPVDSLVPGQMVATTAGLRRVRWIGVTSVDLARHPCPDDAAPVRITAGAFAAGVPHRDLLLSPDHAVRVGDALVPAHLLCNGATVRRERTVASVTYFHVELDRHAVLLADGLAAESYLDTGNRGQFAGERGVRQIHADYPARAWDDHAALPLLLGGAQVRAEHRRLLRRAQAAGYALTEDPAPVISVRGVTLPIARRAADHWQLTLPARTRRISLMSRSIVPCELDRDLPDGRRLGLAIRSVSLDGGPIALDAPAFGAGFHAVEHCAGRTWRCTNGAASLAVPPNPYEQQLELRLAGGWLRYWQCETDTAAALAERPTA